MAMTGDAAYALLKKKIVGLASGYDHTTKTGDNTFDIYFVDGSKISVTIPGISAVELESMITSYFNAHKDELKGDPGKPGNPGLDGYSPSAKVERITGGVKITVIDKSGPTEAIVKDGKDGESGGSGSGGDTIVQGTTVVANPILDGNEELVTSIQIGDEKYVFPQTNTNGLTSAQITMLESVLYSVAFTDASGKSKVDALITSLRSGVVVPSEPDDDNPDIPTDPDEPTVKTLSSISATKTKTSYEVGETFGTSDVVVMAHYSDGTNANVTSSATIGTVDTSASGSKTLNISYSENGVEKTATIAITVVESGGDTPNPPSTDADYQYTDTIPLDVTSGSFNWGIGKNINLETGALEDDSGWAVSPMIFVPNGGKFELGHNLGNGRHHVVLYNASTRAFKESAVLSSPYNAIKNNKGKDYYYRLTAQHGDVVNPTTFVRS